MRQGGALLAEILRTVAAAATVGIRTKDLEALARKSIAEVGAKSAFLGYRGFPAMLCVSINEEIVHGLPSDRVLKDGDVLKLDLGIVYKDLYTDHAITVIVGSASSQKAKLRDVTGAALAIGIEAAQIGDTTGDIGFAIHEYVKSQGFDVVRDLIGHGVGRSVHEEPEVPNYGKPGSGTKLESGMTIAIEPMVVEGSSKIMAGPDGFSFITKDKKLAAHFEHTIAITENGPIILTQ